MSPKADITIIGAGVVGLAIAAQIARRDREVYLLEKNDKFGQETSSRHSGIIHSGIYYPEGSLKARLCLLGNQALYQLCPQYGIGHKRLGKLVVAADDTETAALKRLFHNGRRNGVDGLKLLSRREITELEPNISGVAAILSPSTGIIDAQALMKYFIARATSGGVQIAYRTRVVGLERVAGGYRVSVDDGADGFSFTSRLVINSAGLYGDKVAQMAGIDINESGYRLHYCKGEYFSISSGKSRLVKRLIFPLPPPGMAGLGIHTTLDLDGRMSLGPSSQYVNDLDYTVNASNKKLFYESARRFLPFLEYDDLEPEMAGIRPKLQPPGGEFKDFIIRDESDRDLPGLINLIGIESPGLTASPAIAEYVVSLAEDLLA